MNPAFLPRRRLLQAGAAIGAAAVLQFVRTGKLVFVSGHIARKDGKPWVGQLGLTMTTDEGKAAARAVDHVGLPEARINLAQATVHLALAPKSSSAYAGLDRAIADVRSRPVGEVPAHLRDAHYSGAKHLGHGKGYQYPHDAPAGWVPQQYLPDELQGRTYYEPTPHGAEGRLVARWRERRGEAPPAQDAGEVADPAPANDKTAGDADR